MMTMTKKLAQSLMDDLVALAISANEDLSRNEEGVKLAEEYAKETFISLCDEWTSITGKDWRILVK